MIVTFNPNLGNGDYTAKYLNFLRCVTAIMTAPAGTTSLTVNPLTATGAINTTFNCIVSIDANTEAGGWTTSASHNVPGSLVNTAQTYAALATHTVFNYKADFYKSSGKTNAACPYLKMSFHSYNDYAGAGENWANGQGGGAYNHVQRSNLASTQGQNMLITYGHSSTTNWSSGFQPANNGNGVFNSSNQLNSHTLNSDFWVGGSGVGNTGPGLVYSNAEVQYKMAVGADYCVIWEEVVGYAFATGNWANQTSGGGGGGTYWNQGRYGSVFYMGTRDVPEWENSRDDNPAWVCWQTTLSNTASGAAQNPWACDAVVANMPLMAANGNITAPSKVHSMNTWNNARFNAGSDALTDSTYDNQGYYTSSHPTYQQLDVPIFKTRYWGGGTTQNAIPSQGTSSRFGNLPQVDPVSGTLVPGAYPIVISKSGEAQSNSGGKCRGIYKSLTMPWVNMKQYWQSSAQTFLIGGETYLPFVIKEDMWLVKFA